MNRTEMPLVIRGHFLLGVGSGSQLLPKPPERLLHSLLIYVRPLPVRVQMLILSERPLGRVGLRVDRSVRRLPKRTREQERHRLSLFITGIIFSPLSRAAWKTERDWA